jgi:hypothetical protein
MLHSYTTKALRFFDLYGDYHNAFYGSAASFAALLDATDHSFVDFYGAGKLLAFCIDHSHPKTMQHRPGDSILRSEGALQCLGRHTVFCSANMPGCLEPGCERCPGLIEDRSCTDSRAMATTRAS